MNDVKMLMYLDVSFPEGTHYDVDDDAEERIEGELHDALGGFDMAQAMSHQLAASFMLLDDGAEIMVHDVTEVRPAKDRRRNSRFTISRYGVIVQERG